MGQTQSGKIGKALLGLVLLLGLGGNSFARNRHVASPFKYAGGTEKIPESCRGLVEVGSAALTFKYPDGSLSVPYSSITLMEYRPRISRKILDLKINWAFRPGGRSNLIGGKNNRYFTVVYEEQGTTHAIVLDVPPETMRPYLAEIDVKAGKRVEVKETTEYD